MSRHRSSRDTNRCLDCRYAIKVTFIVKSIAIWTITLTGIAEATVRLKEQTLGNYTGRIVPKCSYGANAPDHSNASNDGENSTRPSKQFMASGTSSRAIPRLAAAERRLHWTSQFH